MDVKWELIDDDQEGETTKPMEKDHLGTAIESRWIGCPCDSLSFLEYNDLFGGAVSESDEEDASQKGSFDRQFPF